MTLLPRLGRLVVGGVLASVLSFSVAAQDSKPPLQEWHDGVVEAKSDSGFVFMADKGGFAAGEGISLDMMQFKGDALALRAMLAGDLDSYEGNPGGPLIAASRGADIKIIGCYWPILTNGIFVRGAINTIADLRGKEFAISSPGALPDLFARAVLAQNGIADTEVKFAAMGSDTDRYRALSAGIADAAVISTEFEPIAAKEGIKLLVHPHDAAPNYLRFCINTSSATLAKRHDAVVHFLAAENEGAALRARQPRQGAGPHPPDHRCQTGRPAARLHFRRGQEIFRRRSRHAGAGRKA